MISQAAVDDKVGRSIADEQKMHEANHDLKPKRWVVVNAAEKLALILKDNFVMLHLMCVCTRMNSAKLRRILGAWQMRNMRTMQTRMVARLTSL